MDQEWQQQLPRPPPKRPTQQQSTSSDSPKSRLVPRQLEQREEAERLVAQAQEARRYLAQAEREAQAAFSQYSAAIEIARRAQQAAAAIQADVDEGTNWEDVELLPAGNRGIGELAASTALGANVGAATASTRGEGVPCGSAEAASTAATRVLGEQAGGFTRGPVAAQTAATRGFSGIQADNVATRGESGLVPSRAAVAAADRDGKGKQTAEAATGDEFGLLGAAEAGTFAGFGFTPATGYTAAGFGSTAGAAGVATPNFGAATGATHTLGAATGAALPRPPMLAGDSSGFGGFASGWTGGTSGQQAAYLGLRQGLSWGSQASEKQPTGGFGRGKGKAPAGSPLHTGADPIWARAKYKAGKLEYAAADSKAAATAAIADRQKPSIDSELGDSGAAATRGEVRAAATCGIGSAGGFSKFGAAATRGIRSAGGFSECGAAATRSVSEAAETVATRGFRKVFTGIRDPAAANASKGKYTADESLGDTNGFASSQTGRLSGFGTATNPPTGGNWSAGATDAPSPPAVDPDRQAAVYKAGKLVSGDVAVGQVINLAEALTITKDDFKDERQTREASFAKPTDKATASGKGSRTLMAYEQSAMRLAGLDYSSGLLTTTQATQAPIAMPVPAQLCSMVTDMPTLAAVDQVAQAAAAAALEDSFVELSLGDAQRTSVGQWSELAVQGTEPDADGRVQDELASRLVGTECIYIVKTPCRMHLSDGSTVELIVDASLEQEQADWDAMRLSQRLWRRLARMQGQLLTKMRQKARVDRIMGKLRQKLQNSRLWYELECIGVFQASTEPYGENASDGSCQEAGPQSFQKVQNEVSGSKELQNAPKQLNGENVANGSCRVAEPERSAASRNDVPSAQTASGVDKSALNSAKAFFDKSVLARDALTDAQLAELHMRLIKVERELGKNLTPKQRARQLGRSKVERTTAAQAAMIALITHLEDHCWLQQSVRGADCVLYTDNSGYGIGSWVMQKDENGLERPVAMIKRSPTETEMEYSLIEGEALALVWAVDRLKHLLQGSKTAVHTDHKPLIYIFKGAGQRAKLLRWSLLLQKYDLEVEYIEGKANILADFASRMPLHEWLGLMDDAAFDLASVIPPTTLVLAAYEEWKAEFDRKLLARKCEVCNRRSELGGAVLCDRCGRTWHFECISMAEVPEEYWYCQECQREVVEKNQRDLTLDSELVDFLVHGKLPSSSSAEERVRAASAFLRWHNGQLQIKKGENWLIVPAIAQREEVIEERHVLLRHAGVTKLLSSLRQEFWWSSMADDVSRVVRQCDACQKLRASFGPNKTLQPTYKGLAPFQIWSIDSMPNLGGHRGLVIVCVDCFSKWVEIGVTESHSADSAWKWFYETIICRYGVPFVVRSDQGTEYKGEFDAGCKDWGIQNRRASTRYPQANGQAERFVGLIKAALKKFCGSIESGTDWLQYIGEIAMGLRFTVARAHGMTPFRVLFGLEPNLPSSIQSREFDLAAALATPDAAAAEEFVESLAAHMASIREEVARKLALYDARSKKYFDAQHAEQEEFEFTEGQAVLLKQRKTGGVRLPAQGPYRFLRYLSKAKRTAVIQNPETGSRIECSAAHLLPYFGQLGEIEVAEDELVGTRPHKKRPRGRPKLRVSSG